MLWQLTSYNIGTVKYPITDSSYTYAKLEEMRITAFISKSEFNSYDSNF